MLHSPVVPEHQHVRLPAVAVLVLVDQGLAVQHFEDGPALVLRHAFDRQRELRIDEEHFPAGQRMQCHYRVRHHRIERLEPAQLFYSGLVGREQAPERLEVVHRLEPRKEALPAVRQPFVHRAHAGEGGITADFGDDLGAQRGSHRRRCAEGLVGVPHVGGGGRVALLVVENDQFGAVGRTGRERVHAELAEITPEAPQVLRGDDLVRKDEHEVLGMRHLECVEGRLRERPGQVDAGDLGTQKDAEAFDRDRRVGHRVLSVQGRITNLNRRGRPFF